MHPQHLPIFSLNTAPHDGADETTKDKTMTALTHTHAKGASLLARLHAATDALSDRIAAYRMYRRTYNELSALTNGELADLGLHRSELRRVALESAGKL